MTVESLYLRTSWRSYSSTKKGGKTMRNPLDRLSDKCRESDAWAWGVAIGGIALMILIYLA